MARQRTKPLREGTRFTRPTRSSRTRAAHRRMTGDLAELLARRHAACMRP